MDVPAPRRRRRRGDAAEGRRQGVGGHGGRRARGAVDDGAAEDAPREARRRGAAQPATPTRRPARPSRRAPCAPRSPPRRARASRRPRRRRRRSRPRRRRRTGPVYASPSVRRLARERASTSSTIQGTGRRGRISPEDLDGDGGAPRRAAPAAAPAAPRRCAARRSASTLTRIQQRSRGEPLDRVADDPARHAPRGRRHHRPRGVPQAAQRRAVRREGHDGRAAAEGVRRRRSTRSRASPRRSTATS